MAIVIFVLEINPSDNEQLYVTSHNEKAPIEVKAIPYFSWRNRGPGEMVVWIREE
ncbi:hypothetical protein KHA93_12815 [Bacillus sp. FJAT-49732]|uniref:Non-reducing end beta-L-arabinofuranosidase-like GH127 C-terminal domain-containing protein n=1 Tax=Lederbergia citrisecunda TaxID=2833583 RepID=A0A942TR03_9BACI|nr:hypothetical protein [Lederbergia citrisecunda]MBS4200512.1 hypothetical protein [Lederbergia citrisecunda]